MSVEICRWKHGFQFAYSVTYDEGFVDLLEHALPIHQKYGIPGHLVMVAGQLGQLRDVPSSTYDGLRRHLSAQQLRDLISAGWSVGDHSMTHGDLNVDAFNEVVISKRVLEDAIGQPVNVFHLPGANFSYAPAARYIKEAGFLAVFFADDRVNPPDPDLMCLSRTLMYVNEGKPWTPLYSPFPREYDPYHRLHEVSEAGGWLVDVTHAVEPNPLALWKDVTPEVLDARFDCLRQVGAGQEWATEPEEIVDYIIMRRACAVRDVALGDNGLMFDLECGEVPGQLKHKEVSFTARLEKGVSTAPLVLVDGQEDAVSVDRWGEDGVTFTCQPGKVQSVVIRWAE